MVAPGWASASANALRGVGIVLGLLLLWLGVLTGGFFLLLTGALALISGVGGWLLGSLVTRATWYDRSNGRPLTFSLVVAFPVALFVFAQVAGPLLTPPPQTTACVSGTLARYEQRGAQLAVDPRIKSMEFRVRVVTVDGGAVRYFAQDPRGQSEWSGREETAGLFESGPIEATSGQWTINIVSEASRVDYQFEWRSLDPLPSPGTADCLG